MRINLLLSALLLMFGLLASSGCKTGSAAPHLDRQSYGELKRRILPDASEDAWQEIPWRSSYADGVAIAAGSGKPLLLWVMNGHPLGCT